MDWTTVAEVVDHFVTAIAIVVGGGWVLYQYVIRRAGESGLSIEVETMVTPDASGSSRIFIDVRLKNSGQRRLEASTRAGAELATEFENSVGCAGSLQIRQTVAGAGPLHLDWWSNQGLG